MALKKSQLYSSLWSSCDELRGGMDASQYKDYVLTLLFMKYVSDKYAGKPNALIEVPEGGSFADMVKLKGDKEIGDKINKIIARLAEANDLRGVIDVADFNDEDKLGRGKEMQDRLSKLVAIFESLDFRANRAEGDDLLGDAYEYLMRHFATESGKSKGQFYTPAEVSQILSRVVGIGRDTTPDQAIYDPTCGSGSLLLKAAAEAPRGVSVYGQEMDNATWALARMNMILHGYETAELWRGNTLAAPHFKNVDGSLKQFDFAVANPPFSTKAWTSGFDPEHDLFGRFELGVPPKKNGDYAFLLHIISSLKSTGKAAVILPHGVLFRGSREADIRRELIRRGLIKGIIGLPPNLFYGTGIPACIVVGDKEGAASRTSIFMIDASRGFVKDGSKNRLRAQDIHMIVDVFTREVEVDRYSRFVPVEEIGSPVNNFNLNIARYIDASEPEDTHDLDAHFRGGIPNRDIDGLQPFWAVFPALRDELFEPDERAGYCDGRVSPERVKATVVSHPQFQAYAATAHAVFAEWREAHRDALLGLAPGVQPKALIDALSNDLLERFISIPLLNEYDVYQRLMDYWAEAMQDDVYLVAADGWQAGRLLRTAQKQEAADFVHKGSRKKATKYVAELIPPQLVIDRYFKPLQDDVDRLQADLEDLAQQKDEVLTEHGDEDGALFGGDENGGFTKAAAVSRVAELKEALLQALPPESEALQRVRALTPSRFGESSWLHGMQDDEGLSAELDILHDFLQLLSTEAATRKAHVAATQSLYEAVIAKYAALDEQEIRVLVVDDKWLDTLASRIEDELQRVPETLVGRVKELEQRYQATVGELTRESDELNNKVESHLRHMGFEFA